MNIFSKIKKNIAILFLFITSCEYLDLCSIANSDTIDFRFNENKNYSSHPNPIISNPENFSFLFLLFLILIIIKKNLDMEKD